MSFLTQVVLEAERASVVEFVQALERDPGLRAIMREQGLQAAIQAAARQQPVPQEPKRPPLRQDPGHASPVVADSGRVVRAGDSSHRRPDPSRVAGFDPSRVPGSTQVGGGGLTHNNTPGRPDVSMVGRSRPTKPMQSGKSKIVPEPDQGKSERPGSRPVTGPLEPRG